MTTKSKRIMKKDWKPELLKATLQGLGVGINLGVSFLCAVFFLVFSQLVATSFPGVSQLCSIVAIIVFAPSALHYLVVMIGAALN